MGSKIVHALVNENHNIICSKRDKSDLGRLEDIKTKIKFIPSSIDGIEAALQYTNFDWVLNMACNYGRSDVLYDNVIEANIEFPLKVLNKVVEKGTKKFLTIGTGLPDNLNMYSFTKKMFSEFGNFYVKKHDIDFYYMKLEMFYGSDEPGERFIPCIIKNMILGNSINVTLGTQHRDIIAIGDVVKAILCTMNSKLKGYCEIPVGTGIAPTISEIVDYIWNKTGKRSVVNFGAVPMRKNEPDCVANIEILKSISKWNPIFWQDGISRMIDEIRKKQEESM